MGLPMNNLHAPTVASGPTSHGPLNGDTKTASLFELMDQRDRVQSEISALGAVLDSVSSISLPLILFTGLTLAAL